MKKALTLLGGLLFALSAGTGLASASVSAQDVQQMIIEQLTPKLGVAPDSVVCPGELATDVGSSINCQVTAGGETHEVTVGVVSVDNGAISFSMQLVH